MKINEALQCCIELSESHVSTTLFPPSWPCQSSSSRPKVRKREWAQGRPAGGRRNSRPSHMCTFTRTRRHRAPSSSHAQPNRSFQAAALAAAASQPQTVRTSLPILALSPNISTWPNALKETFKKFVYLFVGLFSVLLKLHETLKGCWDVFEMVDYEMSFELLFFKCPRFPLSRWKKNLALKHLHYCWANPLRCGLNKSVRLVSYVL